MSSSSTTLSLPNFRKTLTYLTQAPAERIQADLKMLAKLDQEAEVEQAKFNKLLILAIVCIFGSAFLTQIIPALGIILIIGFIGLAVFAGLRAYHEGQFNLPNHRYQSLQSILELLSRDIDADQPFKVHLVLSPMTSPKKKVKPKRGVKVIGNRSFFEDQWLTLSSRLADKTSFTFHVNECFQIKHKRKGRTSEKPKGLELTLVLAYPPDKYQQLDQIASQAQQAIRLPPKASLKSLSFQKQRIRLKVKVSTNFNPQVFGANPQAFLTEFRQVVMMMFLSAYQILNLARKLTPSVEKP